MNEYSYKNRKPFEFWCQHILPVVYDESLSYYELLCKVISYLNNMVSDVNKLSEEYVELQNFVTYYFESAAFMETVNNKLDEFATNGTLQRLIGDYLPILYVDNVDSINTDDTIDFLTANSNVKIIKTKGYYTPGDGGGTTFYLSDSTDASVPITINLGANRYINIEKKQSYRAAELGFKNDNGVTNNTEIFNNLNPCECEILFDSGAYAFDELLITNANHMFSFKGVTDKTTYIDDERYYNDSSMYKGTQTFFVPFKTGSQTANTQRFILKIGGSAGYTDYTTESSSGYFSGFNIAGIAFTDKGYAVSQYLVSIEYCAFISGNLSFRQCVNKCLSMRNTWEHYWEYIIFRSVTLSPTNSCWYMLNKTTSSGNISAIVVDLLDVEGIQSTVLNVSSGANFNSSTVNTVQIEGSILNNSGDRDNAPYALTRKYLFVDTSNPWDQNDVDSAYTAYLGMKHVPLFDINNGVGITFGTISLQNVGYWYFNVNAGASDNYVHTLFRGIASMFVRNVVQDTTFHYFTVSEGVNTNGSRYITIGNYQCDKANMQPAVTSNIYFDYRAFISNNTVVNNSTINVYMLKVDTATPPNTYYHRVSKSTDIRFIQSSMGCNVYSKGNDKNDVIVISGRTKITIIPKTYGACDGVSAVFGRSSADITIERYYQGNLVDTTSFSGDGSVVRRRFVTLPSATHDQYAVYFTPATEGTLGTIELCELSIIKSPVTQEDVWNAVWSAIWDRLSNIERPTDAQVQSAVNDYLNDYLTNHDIAFIASNEITEVLNG